MNARLAQLREHQVLGDLASLSKDGLHGIEQISELVVNLKNFSRLDRSKVASFNVNEGISATLLIAKPQLRNVTVERRFGEIPSITCSPSQVNQVLLNLVTNAAQALDKPDRHIVVTTRREGADAIAIEVADNGKGIPPEALPKIFDPFFTTKEVGKGTGLGLSIAYKIVSEHGGRIDVKSQVGKGIGLHGDPAVPVPGGARGDGLKRCRSRNRSASTSSSRILGKGATGLVLRGFDPGIKRPVALKVITKSLLDPADVDYVISRFRHEAEAVGRLTHPRIAAIYDFIETEDLACIVMELVNGKSLAHHLKEVTQYGFKDTWEIIRQVLDGLALLARAGRDPPRPEARQHPHQRRRPHQDHRLRRRAHRHLDPHRDGRHRGHAALHGPRAVRRRGGHAAHRPLPGRRDPLRAPHRHAALQRQQRRDPAPRDERAARQPLHAQPEGHLAARLGGAEGARQGPGGPLRLRARIQRRAQGRARGKPRRPARGGGGGRGRPAPRPPARRASWTRRGSSPARRTRASWARRRAGDAPVSTFAPGADAKKARVLFVDDEDRILNGLRTLFRGQYHVFTAENGALALEFVKRFGIHVVVSDQRMPNMTGVELLRQVKELSPNSVRMLLTGYSDLAAIVGSINEGEVYRFVKKPWDNAEMQKTVADAVAIAMELAAAPPASAAKGGKIDASILVIDSSAVLAEGLKSVLGDVAPVRLVAHAGRRGEGARGGGGRAHRRGPLRRPGRRS